MNWSFDLTHDMDDVGNEAQPLIHGGQKDGKPTPHYNLKQTLEFKRTVSNGR
jgi:hypothetical protein